MDNQNSDKSKQPLQAPPAVSYYDTVRQSQDPVSMAKKAVMQMEKRGMMGLMAAIVLLIAIPFVVISSQKQTQNKSNASIPTPKTVQAVVMGHVFFDQDRSGIEKNPLSDGIAGVEIIVDSKIYYTDSNGNFTADVIPGSLDSAGNLTDTHHIVIVPLQSTIVTTSPLSYDRPATTVIYYDNALALKRQNNPYNMKLPDVLPKPIVIGLGRIADPSPSYIQGYTFLDENGNGVFDQDIEPAMPQIPVSINGTSTTSSTGGLYRHDSLPQNGTYKIMAVPPLGMHLTTPLTTPVTTGRHDIGFGK